MLRITSYDTFRNSDQSKDSELDSLEGAGCRHRFGSGGEDLSARDKLFPSLSLGSY